MIADAADKLLVSRIRRGEPRAWEECIARFEGRLIAFVDSRLRNRQAAEDVVQETFLGFLTSLPNYDDNTPLENFLFAIAAHRLTDVLRRNGRRPAVTGVFGGDDASSTAPAARSRVASSMARSQERRGREEDVVADCLSQLIRGWLERGEIERLQCVEMLFVLGMANKDVASRMNLSEQAVANHKQFVTNKLKDAAARARLDDFSAESLGL